jgi:hypothetical protein
LRQARYDHAAGHQNANDAAGDGGKVALDAEQRPRGLIPRLGAQDHPSTMSRINTLASLVTDLTALGLRPTQTVMVHSSLGKVGYTVGGPVVVNSSAAGGAHAGRHPGDAC